MISRLVSKSAVSWCMAIAGCLTAPAGSASAQCDELQLASPSVREFSIIAANTYSKNLPTNAAVPVKATTADQAITRAQALWLDVLTNAVADALHKSATQRFDAEIERAKKITQRMGEVARTDEQLGASASVSGSTSATNKTGIPSLISMAIEHGAVQREDNGTAATFSTSPYALVLLGTEDTHQTFNDYAALRRLGVSATFDLDESKSMGSGRFDADKLSAVTTRVRLHGDRSARTTEFVNEWTARVAPRLRQHAEDSVQRHQLVLSHSDHFLTLFKDQLASGPSEGEIRKVLRAVLVSKTTEAEARDAVEQKLQAELCTRVIEPITSGAVNVSNLPAEDIVAAAARGITSLDAAETELNTMMRDFRARPVITFQHTWNRSSEGSDYSDFVLAADGSFEKIPNTSMAVPLAPLTLLLNASLSVNHDPDDAMNQDTIREYGISGSLEKSLSNPLRIGTQAELETRMSFSVTGRYARQKDTDADIGVVQGRLVFPLVRGFSFVVALNYATRTETDSDSEVRLAGGLEFNGDTFASLSQLQSLLDARP